MPVEFALRPRIRLREDSPRPQRSRVRLPRFALPVAAYWMVVGGITYAFVHGHDVQPPLASGDESALAVESAPRENRPWWRRVAETPAPEPALANAKPTSLPEATEQAIPEPAPEPAVRPEPAPTPTPDPRPAAAISARREPVESRASNPAFVPQAPPPARTSSLAPAEPPTIHDAPDETPSLVPPRSTEARSNGLPSCEAAIESAHQDVDFSQGNGTADLPTSVIAAILENGAWLSSCGVPASTSLEVCVAIRGGNVIGASAVSRPPNTDVTACVKRRASSLQFPYSSHVDIARTRF
ncbi:MAG: hypothetical protein ABIQ16_18185 [Polyangiaceae bacterium]